MSPVTLLLSIAVGSAGVDGPMPEPPTFAELRALPKTCPIVYDNDWLGDTVDDEYLFALVHLGRAELRGLVLSKDEWDGGRQYSVEDGRRDFEKDLAIVRASGFRHVPAPTVGADRILMPPESGRAEDLEPVPSAGSDLIVHEARAATPESPLVVIVGGPLTTVASALLTAPEIGDRLIVMMTDIDGYNGTDPWANYVVATRAKLANFGASPLWWPQRPDPPVLPIERCEALPDGPLAAEILRVASMFWERSTLEDRPDRDDGFADGAGLFLLTRPESWLEVRKVRVDGAWSHSIVEDHGRYHYLDAVKIDPAAMTEEFFATIDAAIRDAERTR